MHFTTYFHLYLISLHIETKMPSFKRVNASRFFSKLPFNERNQKNNKKKWFWRALSSILRVFAVLFPHKNDENRTVNELSKQKF